MAEKHPPYLIPKSLKLQRFHFNLKSNYALILIITRVHVVCSRQPLYRFIKSKVFTL